MQWHGGKRVQQSARWNGESGAEKCRHAFKNYERQKNEDHDTFGIGGSTLKGKTGNA